MSRRENSKLLIVAFVVCASLSYLIIRRTPSSHFDSANSHNHDPNLNFKPDAPSKLSQDRVFESSKQKTVQEDPKSTSTQSLATTTTNIGLADNRPDFDKKISVNSNDNGSVHGPLSMVNAIKTIEEKYYKDVNKSYTYRIPQEEKTGRERAMIYGELLPESVAKIIQLANVTENDVFYDLGSGTGKIPIQIYLSTMVARSVGVEISKTRHSLAMFVRKEMEKDGMLDPNRELKFLNQDMADIEFNDATFIFTDSLMFPPELIDKLSKQFAALKSGSKIFTIKPLAANNRLRLVKELNLPTSWNRSGSPVNYYIVV